MYVIEKYLGATLGESFTVRVEESCEVCIVYVRDGYSTEVILSVDEVSTLRKMLCER